jgi:3-deoxy-manno-octulosonate cytidylyltransferase (CMP-KDO synthetase)
VFESNDTGSRAVLGVIPARYGASRFPGKPLALLWGKPLLQHVWERASEVTGLDERVIATDDPRIADAARGFGATVEMTSPEWASGTDRVAEVARRHRGAEIVIKLQGDEPELDARGVDDLIAGMRAAPDVPMATLAHPESDPAFLVSPDLVKVWVDGHGFALYFSRNGVAERRVTSPPLRHIGVYGFRREFLLEFASWPPGEREQAERLEQWRALERGVRIRVFTMAKGFTGVDTPAQLAALEQRGPMK